jgi:signal transduction histidine kinase
MLLVAAIPALAVGAVTVGVLFALAGRADDQLSANQAALAEDTIGARQAEQAQLVVAGIDAFVGERLSDAIDWSRSAPVVEAAGAVYPEVAGLALMPVDQIDATVGPGEQLDRTGRTGSWLLRQTEEQPAFVQAVLTDVNGFTVGAARTANDFTSSDQEWWQRAWSQGAHLDVVEIDGSTGVLSFALAVRVDDPGSGRSLGVLKTMVAVASIQPLTDAFADEELGVDVSVLTTSGLLLAETASAHDPARISTELPFEGEHGVAYGSALAGSDPTGYIILDDTVGGFSRTERTRAVERLGIEIENHDWVAFVEQPTSSAFAPLIGLESLSSDLSTTARIMAIVVLGVVLAALAGALLLGRMLATGIARPINELSFEANRLADVELPELVASLQAPGAAREIPVIEPLRVDADGEVADLATAFNSVRSTAVGLAAEQAIGRSRDVSELLTSLGRRNQQLVGRQLRYIDDLERTESDPDVLRNLFVLDQMATRMRRNAESLLVLAGEHSPRRVGQPRQIDEVIRAAVSEVEDYARVRLAVIDPAMVTPRAVNNLTHLLAELIENATNFSPPDELVEVFGTADPEGTYTVSVIDRGVGMSRARLQEANHRLRGATFARDSTSDFLGLHVVGRLAARDGIDARLVESPTIGTTAKVTLPPSCLAETPRPAGEVPGNRLGETEVTESGEDPSLSWPPPVVAQPAPAATTPPATVAASGETPFEGTEVPASEAEHELAPEPFLGLPPSLEFLAAAALDAADALDSADADEDATGERTGLVPSAHGDSAHGDSADPDRADPDRADPDRADPDRAHPDRAHPDSAHPDGGHDDSAHAHTAGEHSAGEHRAAEDRATEDRAAEDGTSDDRGHDGRLRGDTIDEDAARPPRPAAPVQPVPFESETLSFADATGSLPYRQPEEDDTVGIPIPPFRARESKRPVVVPDPATTDGIGDDDSGPDWPSDETDVPQRFHVRRRVRRHHESGGEILEPITPDLPEDGGDAEARAADVRARLDRFASGVRAAKDPPPATPAATGELLRVELEAAAAAYEAESSSADSEIGDADLVAFERRTDRDDPEAPAGDDEPTGERRP